MSILRLGSRIGFAIGRIATVIGGGDSKTVLARNSDGTVSLMNSETVSPPTLTRNSDGSVTVS